MDPIFGGALISAGSSILNGVGNLFGINNSNNTNREIADSVNQTNKEINQSQLDYNWQMWHAQNDYNNPAAQRQRLVDAGLNPIYYGLDGNSAASGNAFSPIAAQQAPPTIPMNFDAFGDAALKLAQVQNLNADSDLKRSSTKLTDEQALTESSLRAGRLQLLGSNIKVADADSLLKGAQRKQTLASIDAMRQSMRESQVRILDLRNQMNARNFNNLLHLCEYQLDKDYKSGLLSLEEKRLAVSWFEAYTNRQNSSINYFNAQTARYSAYNDAFDKNATRPYRTDMMESITHFNDTNRQSVFDANKRLNKAFKYEQIIRASDAFKATVDKYFAVPDKVIDNGSKMVNSAANMVDALVPF